MNDNTIKSITNDITIQIHYEWFYYKNVLQMIVLFKCIMNDFTEDLMQGLFAFPFVKPSQDTCT